MGHNVSLWEDYDDNDDDNDDDDGDDDDDDDDDGVFAIVGCRWLMVDG